MTQECFFMDGTLRDRLSGAAVALTLGLGLADGVASAQAPAPIASAPSSAASDLATALERTRGQGIPTVVIATASANPQSKALYREVSERLSGKPIRP
jgi:hypothetical protein